VIEQIVNQLAALTQVLTDPQPDATASVAKRRIWIFEISSSSARAATRSVNGLISGSIHSHRESKKSLIGRP